MTDTLPPSPPPIEQPQSCEDRKQVEWWLECTKPAEIYPEDPAEYEPPLKMMI